MARFLGRRVLLAVATLFAVSVLIFLATQVLPGDAARAILRQQATPERLEALREQLNLNRPAVAQYTEWLSGVMKGDLGTSLANGQPVGTLLADRGINTLFLVLAAAFVTIPAAILLGVVSAARRDGHFDKISEISTLALASMPEFIIAIGLTMLFGTVVFRLLPPTSLIGSGQDPWSAPKSVVLPVLTLALIVLPYVMRITRGSMIEVLESDYVEYATLKGLPPRRIIFRHALPNAIGPIAQATALSLAYLAGGAVVVEYVFAYPGVGQALVNAVIDRDVPVVQSLTLMLAAFYVSLNLAADTVTFWLTPSARTQL